MKYRIKIITYTTGRRVYIPQYKTKLYWVGLNYDGGWDFLTIEYERNTREQALSHIDMHYAGNTKKQTIEFEYITK